MNIILATDSYKVSHWKQYPPSTEKIYSYFESRVKEQEIVFFGLQYILKKYLVGSIITKSDIDEAELFYAEHFSNKEIFNRAGWEYIVEEHGGRLPIIIKALKEGSVVQGGTPMFTIENTDPRCYWLTSYLETMLEQVWYPCTIATRSREMKSILTKHAIKTGSPDVSFKLHDFGYRGSTSQESAGIGGAAHLLNFMGTDNLAAISLLKEYYSASMSGFSIPAAEHSTITSWGKERELHAYKNMLEQFPTGLVAVVSDSYNIFEACSDLWGTALKKQVEERDGVLIIRPDSGDPKTVVVNVLDILGEKFGFTTNKKGYRVLPDYLRVIQGDGIDIESMERILEYMADCGWSIDNIAFGSGGGLLQKVDRDTFKFAYKCSNITIDGIDYPVSKEPITDPGKNSKSGRFDKDMEVVFVNGDLKIDYTLDQIKANLG